jgi:tetratricopeptide (TPR) repeat protein
VRLTAKERILIHLADFAKYAGVAEVPPEMGQEGIAHAAAIYVQHVRQFVDPLLQEGLVRERTAHVKGHRRRLKVYDLTDQGRLVAARLREQVRASPIRVRGPAGIEETTIGEAVQQLGGKTRLSDVVRAAAQHEVIELSSLGSEAPSKFIERLGEAPRPRTFVGRSKELEALTRAIGDPRVFVVRGVAGIGKSSLAAEACERLRGTCNLYWHRIRSWDTRLSILAGLAEFLDPVGRPGLRAVLHRGETEAADRVVREDLPGSRSTLIFDDVQEAGPEVVDFLRFLKEVVADTPDARAILLSRRAIPVYDRRDVTILHRVQEIDLQGLAAKEIEGLLASEPGGAQLVRTARRLGGHPLFLELLRSTTRDGISAESLKDVRRFVEEEIYSDLSEAERRMMKVAALYAVPFPKEVLFGDPSMSHDVLLSLTAKSLVRPVAENNFGVHDTIRDFFSSILTPHEREAFAPTAADHLVRLSQEATADNDFITALNCLSNAVELAQGPSRQATLYETLGDTHEHIGDLPAALTSYREAINRREDREGVARLHRKIAAAVEIRGLAGPANKEIEAGFASLGDMPSVERGWLNFVQCRIAIRQEEWGEARKYGEAALVAFQGAADASGQARTKLELANVLINGQGDPAEAEDYLTSALELADPVGEPDFRARVHIVLANLYANRIGDAPRAARHIAAVEAIEGSITDSHVRRSLLFLQGWFALFQQADFPIADARFTEALQLARRIHAPSSLSFAKLGQAYVAYFQGKLEEAREAFERCVAEIDAQGFFGYAMEARWMVAECCLRLGDLSGFLRIAQEFHDPRWSSGVAGRPFHAHVLEGMDRLVHGDRNGCVSAFHQAIQLIKTGEMTPDASIEAFVHWFYGVALRAMGEGSKAEEQLRTGRSRLEGAGLKGQLIIAEQAEPQLVDFLRQTYASERASVQG